MKCENCEIETDDKLCQACAYLFKAAANPHPSWDRELRELARAAPTNRRWQFRFWRKEIKE